MANHMHSYGTAARESLPVGMVPGINGTDEEKYRVRYYKFQQNGEVFSKVLPEDTHSNCNQTWRFTCALCNEVFTCNNVRAKRAGLEARIAGYNYRVFYGWVCECESSPENLRFRNPYSGEITNHAPSRQELKIARVNPEDFPNRQYRAELDEIDRMHEEPDRVIAKSRRAIPDEEYGGGSSLAVMQAGRWVYQELPSLINALRIKPDGIYTRFSGYVYLEEELTEEVGYRLVIYLTAHVTSKVGHDDLTSLEFVLPHYFHPLQSNINVLRKELDKVAKKLGERMQKSHNLSVRVMYSPYQSEKYY